MKNPDNRKKFMHLFEYLNNQQLPEKSLIVENREARLDPQRMKAPWERIVEFFAHDKLDVSKLDQDIVRQIFAGWDDYSDYVDGLSDMEENEDGSLSVEFDGMYGKHWQKFPDHETWHKYYEERVLPEYRNAFDRVYKELMAKKTKKQQDIAHSKTTRNTIGNIISPDVMNKLQSIKEEGGFAISPLAVEPNISNNPEGTPNPNPALPENSRPSFTKKEVRYLKVGDVLNASGAKIIQAPVAGLRTPPGKVEIGVEYPGGRRKIQLWGKYTVVGVSDAIDPQPPVVGAQDQPVIPDENPTNLSIPPVIPEEEELGNTDYNEGVPTSPDTDAFVPKTKIYEDGNAPVLVFKPKAGYWDVTRYPYGGDFRRFVGGEKGQLVKGTVKMGDEIRVRLEDGHEIVCNASSVSNMDTDTVLDLAKANGRVVV